MTTKRLLDRQVELVSYLTSGAAIFDDAPQAPLDPALAGIDRGLLRLEARLSFGKRMDKIIAVFPRTFALLGSEKPPAIRAFADTCPPVDISRRTNARQFHEFLLARWRRATPEPPYLPDVAACELACAAVRVDAGLERGDKEEGTTAIRRSGIRRHPNAVLLRCAYDIRPIFEEGSRQIFPAARQTLLAVSMPPAACSPQVSEVTPAVFDLLTALDDWVDPAALGTTPDTDDLVRELADHGLLQVLN